MILIYFLYSIIYFIHTSNQITKYYFLKTELKDLPPIECQKVNKDEIILYKCAYFEGPF